MQRWSCRRIRSCTSCPGSGCRCAHADAAQPLTRTPLICCARVPEGEGSCGTSGMDWWSEREEERGHDERRGEAGTLAVSCPLRAASSRSRGARRSGRVPQKSHRRARPGGTWASYGRAGRTAGCSDRRACRGQWVRRRGRLVSVLVGRLLLLASCVPRLLQWCRCSRCGGCCCCGCCICGLLLTPPPSSSPPPPPPPSSSSSSDNATAAAALLLFFCSRRCRRRRHRPHRCLFLCHRCSPSGPKQGMRADSLTSAATGVAGFYRAPPELRSGGWGSAPLICGGARPSQLGMTTMEAGHHPG